MATPYGYSGASFSDEPSRTLLQKLLEEINGSPTPTVLRGRSTSVVSRPSHIRPSAVWVGGAPIAQDARRKLRAADEARMRHGTSDATDGAAGDRKPILRADSSHPYRRSLSSIEDMRTTRNEPVPDPVAEPHDYLRFMARSDPDSSDTPAATGGLRLETSFLDVPHASSGGIDRPLSPLIFSDVDFEDMSVSSLSNDSASPTEAPTSATTITAEQPRTPSDDGSTHPSKRTFSPLFEPQTLSKRMRTMTLPEPSNQTHSKTRTGSLSLRASVGVDRDSRFVVQDPTFTERVGTPRGSMHQDFPEVSSFRPSITTPQGQPTNNAVRPVPRVPPPSRNPSASPGPPDTPPWMRPMHLVDTETMSIYKNVHGDSTRYSLCLHCFSQHGNFCKVLTYGYETCGRHEVLNSHYWESGAWPEDSDGGD